MHESNPAVALQQIAAGYCLSRCLHVVADLGVADALDERPRTAAELAASVGAHPDALGRALRLLAAHGVFERRGEEFRHSPTSRLLRVDHPHSVRDFVRLTGLSINWATFQSLEHSVRTGMPAVETVHPGGFWAYYAGHPEASRVFNAAMAAKAQSHIAAILAAYDFSGFGVIGDIGGGRGHLLRAVLESAPGATGVLFDQPHVIGEAAAIASERLRLRAGDFFTDDLPACDVYLVMEIIHDWADAESIAILKAIRRAAPGHARLLLIESIVPDDPGPDWAKTLDILMLALLGGRQRTRLEYEALFQEAGFAFGREIPTGAGISILEARVA